MMIIARLKSNSEKIKLEDPDFPKKYQSLREKLNEDYPKRIIIGVNC